MAEEDQTSPIPRPSRTGGQRQPRTTLPPGITAPIPLNTRDVRRVLDAMLTVQEPKLSRILYSTRNAQSEALKFQEIRNAIRNGELDEGALERFRGAYAQMVEDEMLPVVEQAASRGAAYMAASAAARTGRDFDFPETTERIDEYLKLRGASLVRDITTQQRLALNTMVRSLARDQIGAREAGRYIRTVIGLTGREAGAVDKMRSALQSEGSLSSEQVVNRVQNYSGFLLRRRADRIARTELVGGFNRGNLALIQAAQANGTLGRVVKKWYTALDERTCDFCGELHEQVVGLDETYPAVPKDTPNTMTPPAHPNCRCTIIYETESADV